MKPSFPLVAKILIVATINVVVLAVAGLAFVRYELGHDFGSFLLAPGRERIQAVSRQMALDLSETTAADRDALLARYRQEHGVDFLLFVNDGTRIAGPAIDVPPAVIRRIAAGRGGPEGRGGPPPPPPPPPPGELGRGPHLPPNPRTPPELVTTDGATPYWVIVRIPLRAKGDADTKPGTLVLASPSLLGTPFYFQPVPWLGIVGVTLVLTMLCWLPLVRGVTRSIGEMTRATGEIAAGRFDAVPSIERRDELGVLAAAIQSMARRLETLLAGQKRFLRDAAHELRSPLGRMSLSLGLLERDAGDASQRHVADVREELDVMTALTNELLAFARAEVAAQELKLAPTSVRDAALRAVRIEARGADVRVDVDEQLRVMADADLLFRAISNLIRNAVAHAGSSGPIDVHAWRDERGVGVTVADRGRGVPDADLDRVFLPFYRPEDSRDRQTGGAGLGLAIVRAAVEACRGSVSCHNLSPAGFEVTLRLPAA